MGGLEVCEKYILWKNIFQTIKKYSRFLKVEIASQNNFVVVILKENISNA